MWYRLLLFIVLIYSNFFLYSQERCIQRFSGQVLDPHSHAVAGAVVSVGGDSTRVITDNAGRFVVDAGCGSRVRITISALGYETTVITADRSSDLSIRLSENVRQLDEVLISGTLEHSEHSHNFSTLHADDLDRTAGKSLGEALSGMAGVNTIQSGPGIFKPVIHGVHSQRILILNHGIRQEGQQWGAEHAPEIDPFIAADITVIKDASSIKYGTDALGGVVVVNPPELPEQPGISGVAQTVFQSNGRSVTLSGLLEGGISKQPGWGWRIQGTGKRAGDYQTPDYNLTNTGIRELNFSGAVGYHNKQRGLEIYFSHFETTIGILKGTAINSIEDLRVAMEREPPAYTADFTYEIGAPRQEVKHNLLKIHGHINTNAGGWRFQYGFQNNKRKEYTIRAGDLNNIPNINLRLNTHTFETEFEKPFNERHTICLGMTAMIQDNENVYGTQRVPFVPNFLNMSAGAFSVIKLNTDNWIFDLGARYDFRNSSVRGLDYRNALYHSTFSFHNASISFGATGHLGTTASFSTNLSSAWRPPHVVELFSQGMHQSAAANEYGLLLDPETNQVKDLDLMEFNPEQAIKWVNTFRKHWKSLSVEATVYANYIFNYIYLRPSGVTTTVSSILPALRYRQTDALFAGSDVGVQWEMNKNLSLETRLTYLRASDVTNDDYLVYIPGNKVDAVLRYEKKRFENKPRIFAEAKGIFRARQMRAPMVIDVETLAKENNQGDFSGRIYDFMEAPPSYFLLNMATGISIPAKQNRVDLRVGVDNVLNTSYREYSNRLRYYADDLGRNFSIALKFFF